MVLGISLAFGGLPFYQNNIIGCHIQSHPAREGSWHPLIWFTLVPIFGTIFLTSALLLRVYLAVNKQRQRASKWQNELSFRSSVNEEFNKRASCISKIIPSVLISSIQQLVQRTPCDAPIEVQSTFQANKKRKKLTPIEKLEREVLIQCFFYVGALYVCWTFILAAYLESGPLTPEIEGLDLYPFYLTCFMIAPLQGFWNCLIYFRSRLKNRWYARKQLQAKQQQEGRKFIFQKKITSSKQLQIKTTRDNEEVNQSDRIVLFSFANREDVCLSDEPEIAVENYEAILEELGESEGIEIKSFYESESDLNIHDMLCVGTE
jgi:hypothetical protein